ncbi:MAG: Si-specific NAD(P)(+) transhydrogenase [Bdellovibrionales bacterium]|nr:Si-specific NAD(P)(+) transhydrogenase [Bdellovibrionales bacterium]
MPNDFDLIVIGSGPAGQRAAVQAAKLKRKVMIIERDGVGGSCLHLGTIPSKTLREAALSPDCNATNAITSVMSRKDTVIAGEEKVIREQLRRNHVELAVGEAAFVSPNEVLIRSHTGARTAKADKIIIATGTRPFRDPALPFDDTQIFDSDTILRLDRLPKRMAILGAGVIGCEYASIFAKLGVSVTLYDRRTHLLRSVDEEIVAALTKQFQSFGISIQLGMYPEQITKQGHQLHLDCGGNQGECDTVLVCMGRNGNTESLQLDRAGLSANNRGLLSVNAHYQTNVPHIYAVGDIIGNPALAASSAEQGRLAAGHAFDQTTQGFPEAFPYGIYTIPEISTVGAQESELKEKNVPYVAGRAYYRELARGKILGDEHGMLKLLVHRETRKILGIHIIGTGATELVHIGQVALALGADIGFFVQNVFNYPTLAEAYKVAAYAAHNQLQGASAYQG